MSARRAKKSTSRARAPRGKARSPRDFWGPEGAEDLGLAPVRAAQHPTALIQSLGPPPLPNGAIAQHYFEVIYERAAALAIALAASAGLSRVNEGDEDDEDDEDH
jgi:hypothetical protein